MRIGKEAIQQPGSQQAADRSFHAGVIMNAERNRYLTLFLSTMQISAFTFGGGFVIIPLMRKTFVGKLGWIDDSEMLDLTAIAQSAPGPIAVNAAILVGYKTGRVAGAIVSILGAILPPFAIISAISFFYQAFRDNIYVSAVLAAMGAGVAAVITDVVVSMAWGVLKQKELIPIAMMIISFVLVQFSDMNIILLMIIAGIIGYISHRYKAKDRR